MKQWIVTVALSISLACGQAEAAGGYTMQRELAGEAARPGRIREAGQGQAGVAGLGQTEAAGQGQAGAAIQGQTQEAGQAAVQGQPGQGDSEDFLKLYAQSAVLMDGGSGRILYGKGEDIMRPMASTTKIMTCILALELGCLDDKVTASSNAASQPKVRLGVRAGEEYRLKDLLYALMLESYNDAAVMIAENVGGTVEGFAALMNQKARELGCGDTYFITPNGLDGVMKDKDGVERIHSTTAADLAAIMRYCVMESPKKEEFLDITRTQNYSFMDLKGKRSYSCFNHNAFLNMMEGVLSGKTGFTGGAGYSYVGALENDNRTYIIALLGCGWPPHKTYKWADARKLYTYGLEHFTLKDVFREEALPDIPVAGGLCWDEEGGGGNHIGADLRLDKEERHLWLLLGEDEQVQVEKKIPRLLHAPVKEGQEIGAIDYRLDGTVVKRYPVYASQGVERMTFSRAFRHILSLFADFGKNCRII